MVKKLVFPLLLIEDYKSWFIVSVCTINGSWETITTFAICLWKLPRARGWVRGVDGLQRCPKILHWKSGQRFVVTPIPHLFQPPGLAALQILRTVSGEIDLRYRRDRRVWPRIEPWRWLQKLWFTFFPFEQKKRRRKIDDALLLLNCSSHWKENNFECSLALSFWNSIYKKKLFV